jgi:hypothetical protein
MTKTKNKSVNKSVFLLILKHDASISKTRIKSDGRKILRGIGITNPKDAFCEYTDASSTTINGVITLSSQWLIKCDNNLEAYFILNNMKYDNYNKRYKKLYDSIININHQLGDRTKHLEVAMIFMDRVAKAFKKFDVEVSHDVQILVP